MKLSNVFKKRGLYSITVKAVKGDKEITLLFIDCVKRGYNGEYYPIEIHNGYELLIETEVR